ncbi:MAG: hypothetical protein R2875_01940 [Desulfobacterales bacterium]
MRGYVGNTYVRVDSAQVSVWLRKTEPELLKMQPASDIHHLSSSLRYSQSVPEPIRLIRLSSQNPCIGEPFARTAKKQLHIPFRLKDQHPPPTEL